MVHGLWLKAHGSGPMAMGAFLALEPKGAVPDDYPNTPKHPKHREIIYFKNPEPPDLLGGAPAPTKCRPPDIPPVVNRGA